jgi:hypothetical protein
MIESQGAQTDTSNEHPVEPRELAPLVSEYQEDQHGTYVRHLTSALQQPQVRNIALTGGYGSGKSSVIDEIEKADQFKVLNVSISSLGNDLADPSGVPRQAPDADLTNRIEKAIVKQLLFRKSPQRLPASEFHRLSKFPVWHRLGTSAAGVLGTAAVPVLLGWDPDPAGAGAAEWVTAGTALAVVTAGVTWIRALLHQRFSVSTVAAAGASVTLARRPSSYFDKYLAEIVYFFEVTDYTVVIFEDLDRFENPGIFEALRELNTILNEADQVNREIRFVYAVRDSVFEKLGRDTIGDATGEAEQDPPAAPRVPVVPEDAAQAEVERANRTKFFDLVIPMVPFITHRSARELLSSLFPAEEDHRPSEELIDLAAQHIPDMRMLKNIRNEYCVFVEQLIVRKMGAPDLSPDTLLALVLYKHLHLADFEKIIQGRSALDTVYDAYRDIVNNAIQQADDRIRHLNGRAARAEAAAQRAEALGARFADFAEVALATQIADYAVGDRRFGAEVEDWLDFWQAAIAEGAVTVWAGRRGVATTPREFSLTKVGRALNEDLTADLFDASAARSVDADLRKERGNREFLRGASMAALVTRPEFTGSDSGDWSGRSFADVVAELKSQLARDLVSEGHIDRNFTLYVGQFYGGRLTKNVQTFIFRNVDTNRADPNYDLTPEEVAALLSETGPRCLRGASAYNINIIDYLLEREDDAVDAVVARLAFFGRAEQQFLEAYLTHGDNPARLLARLARVWPHVLVYLVEEVELRPEARVRIVDAALNTLDLELVYELSDAVGSYIEENYASMTAFTSNPETHQISALVTVTAAANATITDLAPLHPDVRRAIVEADLYPITTGNLRAATASPGPLSLDRIKGEWEALYEDCVREPDAYLGAAIGDGDTSYVIEAPEAFVPILADVADKWAPEHLDALVEHSSPECMMAELDEPVAAWETLAAHRRFPPTARNIEAYHAERGIDDALGMLLGDSAAVEAVDAVDESVRRALATALLRAGTTVGEARQRVQLVTSLGLAAPLAPEAVPVEPGPLLGELLAARVVEDTAELFERFTDTDWPTYEAGIAASAHFEQHVAPETVPEGMVQDMFASDRLSDEVKHALLANLDELLPTDDSAAWNAAATYQLRSDKAVVADDLQRYAVHRVEHETLVRLADRYLDEGGDGAPVLAAFAAKGGPYAGLAGVPGGEVNIPYEPNHELFTRLRRSGFVASAARGKRLGERGKLIVKLR